MSTSTFVNIKSISFAFIINNKIVIFSINDLFEKQKRHKCVCVSFYLTSLTLAALPERPRM